MKILKQTDQWIIIDKPAGQSVHNDSESVVDQFFKEQNLKVYPVHRLDKETSGVLWLAKNPLAAENLAELFQSGKTNLVKTYLAIVRGKVSDVGSLRWTYDISDQSEGRDNPAGKLKDRVSALTEFKVLRAQKYSTWLEVGLITGRQHQIRKHAALAKNEIIGDRRYGDLKYIKRIKELTGFQRMALHAWKLKTADFEVEAEIPEEFKLLQDS